MKNIEREINQKDEKKRILIENLLHLMLLYIITLIGEKLFVVWYESLIKFLNKTTNEN